MKGTLARQITYQVALVIFGAMLVYAGFQYFSGDTQPAALFLKHLWHTAVLGGLIYIVLLWRLRALLMRPLEQVFFHGYEMSQGRFKRQDYPRTGNEIDHVTAIMNQIAGHLELAQGASWKEHADAIERHIEILRNREDLPVDVRSGLLSTRDHLRKMQAAALELAETVEHTENNQNAPGAADAKQQQWRQGFSS